MPWPAANGLARPRPSSRFSGSRPHRLRRRSRRADEDLKLQPGWRRTEDFGWRYRVAGYAAWLWAGVSFEDSAAGVRVSNRSPNWFKKPNRDARKVLTKGAVIIAVDGKSGLDRSELLAYLMREKALGSTVEMTLLRGGQRRTVSFKIPRTQPEVLGH